MKKDRNKATRMLKTSVISNDLYEDVSEIFELMKEGLKNCFSEIY